MPQKLSENICEATIVYNDTPRHIDIINSKAGSFVYYMPEETPIEKVGAVNIKKKNLNGKNSEEGIFVMPEEGVTKIAYKTRFYDFSTDYKHTFSKMFSFSVQ